MQQKKALNTSIQKTVKAYEAKTIYLHKRGDSEKEVAMARSLFAKCRMKKDESDNNTEP